MAPGVRTRKGPAVRGRGAVNSWCLVGKGAVAAAASAGTPDNASRGGRGANTGYSGARDATVAVERAGSVDFGPSREGGGTEDWARGRSPRVDFPAPYFAASMGGDSDSGSIAGVVGVGVGVVVVGGW